MISSRVEGKSLKPFALFSGLSESELNALAGLMHARSFSRKTRILSEGDTSSSVYFILEGHVSVFLEDEGGKEIVLNKHGPGEFFGELGMIRGTPRTASVVALDEVRLGVMTDHDFKRALLRHPMMASNLIDNLAERLCEATESIRRLGLMDVYGRIVLVLNRLADDVAGQKVVRQRMTQQTLANHVGASREMVARIMKDLRKGGYIEVKGGHITIKKPLPHQW